MMQFIGEADTEVSAYEKAFTQFRKVMTEADVGDATPTLPDSPTLVLPSNAAAGIFERLDRRVRRIRAADGYTPTVGALLGIVPIGDAIASPDGWKPILKAEAQPESTAQVKFVRGKSDGIAVQIQRDKEDAWTSFGSFFQSPAVLEIPPKTPDTPEVVRIRARFLVGNEPTGDVSDIIEIVTQP